jgi:hypothetical protein
MMSTTTSAPASSSTSLLGPDSARARLRDTLLTAIAEISSTTTSAPGVEAWQPLAVLAAAPPSSTAIASPPPRAASLAFLTRPAAPYDEDHVRSFLALHQAHHAPSPAAAFDLARSLPCFDRDLTAYYLTTLPATHEHELLVAHSLMRLVPDTVSHADFIHALYPAWRDHPIHAMTHVLAVLAAHWDHTGLPPAPGLEALPLARSYADAEKCVAVFLASSPQHDPTLAPLVEAASAIMLTDSSDLPPRALVSSAVMIP